MIENDSVKDENIFILNAIFSEKHNAFGKIVCKDYTSSFIETKVAVIKDDKPFLLNLRLECRRTLPLSNSETISNDYYGADKAIRKKIVTEFYLGSLKVKIVNIRYSGNEYRIYAENYINEIITDEHGLMISLASKNRLSDKDIENMINAKFDTILFD